MAVHTIRHLISRIAAQTDAVKALFRGAINSRYRLIKVAQVSDIPLTPQESDIIRFTAAISSSIPSTVKGRDGTTTETAVGIGDEYRWDGTNWLKIGDGVGTGGSATDTDTHYTLTRVSAIGGVPSSPAVGDVIRFLTSVPSAASIPSTIKERDGSTVTSIAVGDEYRWDSANWNKIGDGDTHYALTKVSAVSGIPASPGVGDIIRFTAAISASIPSTVKGRDGSTTETAIGIGDEYRWDGTNWLKIGDGSGSSVTDTDTHYTYTEVSAVTNIPSSPATGDIIRFTAAIAASIPSTVKGRDGSTTETAIGIGDEYRWNGTNWLKIGDGDTADTDTDTHYTFTKVGAVSGIPSSPAVSDIIRFTAVISASIPSTVKRRDGATTETAIGIGDEYRWDGTNWLKIGDGRSGITNFDYLELGALVHLGFSETAQPETSADRTIFAELRSGLNQVLAYNEMHNRFLRWPVPSTGGTMYLGDLSMLDTNEKRRAVNGSHWYIGNVGDGEVNIMIGGIGDVFPTGATIEPGGVVEIILFANDVGINFSNGKQFNLIVTPHDEEEAVVPQLHYVTSAPANNFGNDGDIARRRVSAVETRIYTKASGAWTEREVVRRVPRFGTADPPATTFGDIGDLYRNTANGKLWEKTGSATWTEREDLATQSELDAVEGQIFSKRFGTGDPAGSLGAIGDFYRDTDNGKEYEKTATDTWTERFDSVTEGELNNRIIDGRESEPTASAVYENSLLISTHDIVKKVEVLAIDGANAAGAFLEYDGVDVYNVHPGLDGHSSGYVYYLTSNGHFYRLVGSGRNLFPTEVSWDESYVLGTNAIWLGRRRDEHQARNAVRNFNSSNRYFAEFRNTIWELDNDSYATGSEAGKTYEWVIVGRATAELVAVLEDRIKAEENRVQVTPRRVENVPVFGKVGDMVRLIKDAYGPTLDSVVQYEPVASPIGYRTSSSFGFSRVTGLGPPDSGARRPGLDIPLTDFGSAVDFGDIIINGRDMWVLHFEDGELRGYNLDTRKQNTAIDIDLGRASNERWTACATDGSTVWVLNDFGNQIRAWDLHLRTRLTAADSDLPVDTPTARLYKGMATDGKSLWVLNDTSKMIETHSIHPHTKAVTRESSRDFAVTTTTTGNWGAMDYIEVNGVGYIYIIEEADVTHTTSFARAYVAATGAQASDFDIPLRTLKDFDGLAADESSPSGGILYSLNSSDIPFNLEAFDISHSILPAIVNEARLAAMWMPTGHIDDDRYKWHIAYRDGWPPEVSGARIIPTHMDVVWGDGNDHYIENYQAQLRFVETRTIGGNSYHIYREPTLPKGRVENFEHNHDDIEQIAFALRFNDGRYAERDGTTFTAAVEKREGFYYVFAEGEEYERARLGREPFEVLSFDIDRNNDPFTLPENWRDYHEFAWITRYGSSPTWNLETASVPVSALPSLGQARIGHDANNRITFNATTRTVTRQSDSLGGFVSAELR